MSEVVAEYSWQLVVFVLASSSFETNLDNCQP